MSDLQLAVQWARGDFHVDLDLAITPGMTAVFGPSGSGKTTLLNLIAGLVTPTSGRLTWKSERFFDSQEHVNVPAHARGLGYVFQEGRLFPHLTVEGNLRYGLRTGGPALGEVVEVLGLGDKLLRAVGTLSGGERQRVALGRALLSNPALLLLDEPVSALELPVKLRFMRYLETVRSEFGIPALFVTHDPEIVLHFADEVIMLDAGRVTAKGCPRAHLLRSLLEEDISVPNLFLGEICEDGAVVSVDGMSVRVARQLICGSQVWLRIGSTDLMLMRGHPDALSARNIFEGEVVSVTVGSHHALVEVHAGLRWRITLLPSTVTTLDLVTGEPISVVAKATSFQVVSI